MRVRIAAPSSSEGATPDQQDPRRRLAWSGNRDSSDYCDYAYRQQTLRGGVLHALDLRLHRASRHRVRDLKAENPRII
jgi:hypothetical protein